MESDREKDGVDRKTFDKISKYNNKQEEALIAEELHRLAEEALE